MVDAHLGITALNGDSQPHVLRDEPGAEILGHTFSPFGKYLVAVLGSAADGVHDAVDKLERHFLMEDVTHGADEDVMRLTPLQRFFEVVLVEGQSEAVAVLIKPHGLEATSHHLSIAVSTTCRFLGTTRDGIPSLVSPFYFGSFHNSKDKLL